MSEVDKFLDSYKTPQGGSEVDALMRNAPAQDKGVLGHARDTGLSLLKSAIAVPELAVGLADIASGGEVGKTLENKDGMFGFRPKEAKDFLSSLHTDKYKEQQQQFSDADGFIDKTKVALQNPSIITNTVAESIAPMLAGGVVGRGVAAVAPSLAPVLAGSIGEGAVMAGSQAEGIRQQTEDGLLTGGQTGAAVATGALGTLFGYGGGRLAQKLGIGDIDTLIAQGASARQVASSLAQQPAKSIPRKVIEGAITEGFLEELPQSVSEQILQNLALNKPWSEGVEDAAVMGTLAGMVMGGGASILGGHGAQQGGSTDPNDSIEPPQQGPIQQPIAPVYNADADGVQSIEQPVDDYGIPTTAPIPMSEQRSVSDPQTALDMVARIQSGEQAQKPSEQMGLDPNAGPISSAAAIAVDSGAAQQSQQQAQTEVNAESQPSDKSGFSDSAPSLDGYELVFDENGVGRNVRKSDQADAKPIDRATELQSQLDFIKQQAQSNGWDKRMVEARDQAQAELNSITQKRGNDYEQPFTKRAKNTEDVSGVGDARTSNRGDVDSDLSSGKTSHTESSVEKNRSKKDSQSSSIQKNDHLGEKSRSQVSSPHAGKNQASSEGGESASAPISKIADDGIGMGDKAPTSLKEGIQAAQAKAQSKRTDGETSVAEDGMTVVHGSGNPNLTANDITIVRSDTKQQGNKNRKYGGLYTTNEADSKQAEEYAAMMGGSPTLYDVKIKPGTKVLNKVGDITRLSENYINELVSQGYGVVTGKDPRGRTEHVVIDKSAIQEMGVRGNKQGAQNAPVQTVSAPSKQPNAKSKTQEKQAGSDARNSQLGEEVQTEVAQASTRQSGVASSQAENEGAGNTPVSAEAQWNALTTDERKAVASRTDLSAVPKKNIHTATWEKIAPKVRDKLTKAMSQPTEKESFAVQEPSTPTSLSNSDQATAGDAVSKQSESTLNIDRLTDGQVITAWERMGLAGANSLTTEEKRSMLKDENGAEVEKAVGRTSSLQHDSSWVIRNKETGEVVMETSDKRKVNALNREKYEAVPTLEHLQQINRAAKARSGVESSNQSQVEGESNQPTKPQAAEKPVAKSTPATQKEATDKATPLEEPVTNTGEQTVSATPNEVKEAEAEPAAKIPTINENADLSKLIGDISKFVYTQMDRPQGETNVSDFASAIESSSIKNKVDSYVTLKNSLDKKSGSRIFDAVAIKLKEALPSGANTLVYVRSGTGQHSNIYALFKGVKDGVPIEATTSPALLIQGDITNGLDIGDSALLQQGQVGNKSQRGQSQALDNTKSEEVKPKAKSGDIRFSRTESQPKNLFVAHNLSAANILAAHDLGGLAAPSIAVARSDVSDFSGFGEVTLLADPKLLEDSKIRTFDADVYSPRQPRATYELDNKKFNAFVNEVSKNGHNLRVPDISDDSGTDGAEAFVRSDAIKMKYLEEIGKAPALKSAKVEPAIKAAAKLEGNRWQLEQNPKFVQIATKHYRAVLDKINAVGEARALRMESIYFKEDGSIQESVLRDFAAKVDNYRSSGGKDLGQLRSDIAAKMRNDKLRTDFEKWATEQFNSMVTGKTLFKGFTNSGNRKYDRYTLENVVKEMTQALQAGEGTFYGSGSARSAYANEMKTLKDIQSRRDQIISDTDFQKIKEESNQVFSDALEKLREFYKYDANSWGYLNDAGSAIAEGPKGIREAFKVTPESRKIIADLTNYLSNLPTAYFEAKAQRAVQFSEFNTAIVPKGMDKQALQVLRDSGLKIKTYDPKVTGDRARVIAEQEKLLFSFAGRGAQTADLLSLVTAQRRIGAGENAEVVRMETGWHRGVDGKWRFEISDDQATIKQTGTNAGEVISMGQLAAELDGRKSATVGDIIDHPQLFAAYPELSSINVGILPSDMTAQARIRRLATGPIIELNEKMPTNAVASAMLHELQHAIQMKEGFALGGSKKAFVSDFDRTGAETYRRLAGEVEARNTQTRMNMSPNFRRNLPPNETADTPDSQVLVTFNGKDIVNAIPPKNIDRPAMDEEGLVRAFTAKFPKLAPAITKMLARGKAGQRGGVVIVDSADPLRIAHDFAAKTGAEFSDAIEMFSEDGSINGFFDRKSGLTFLVGPNLDAVTAPAVLLHEMIHGQQREKIDQQALSMLMNRGQVKDVKLSAFLDRVAARMVDAGEVANASEAAAYIVEQAVMEGKGFAKADSKFLSWVDSNIGQRVGDFLRSFIRNVRQWMLRNGLPVGDITVDDLVNYAMVGVQRAAEGQVDGGRTAFSRADAPPSEINAIRAQYEGTDQWLKAPNGKPSNLNEQQWLQVRTPSFKNWFGDWEGDPENASKVVDANGEPMVVYHGTGEDKDFTIFNPEKFGSTDSGFQGLGFYFSESEKYAKSYAWKSGSGTKSAFLNLRNPFKRPSEFSHGESWREEAFKELGKYDINRDTQPRERSELLMKHGFDGLFFKKVDAYWGNNGSDKPFLFEIVVYNPNQIKSATDNTGAFDPKNPDIRFSRTGAAAKAFGDRIKGVTVQSVRDNASYKATDLMGIALQALGRRQLVDIYDGMLPLAQYNRLAEQMDADKNDAGAGADQLVRRWAKLTDEKELAELMHDATLDQIDPAKDYVQGDNLAKYMRLKSKFDALTEDAKGVYRDARDSYSEHHKNVLAAIKDRIERSELRGEKKADLLKQMDSEFYKKIKGVYFPLSRFGKYVVLVRDAAGKVESVSRAETMKEAQALRKTMITAFPESSGFSVDRVILDKDFLASRDSVGRGFMTDLYAVLDKQDMSTQQKMELEDILGQLYLSSLPDLSWAKHGIHRKGTPGFSQDARRAFAQNIFHGASYLAKLRYSDRLATELDGMQKQADKEKTNPDFDQPKAQRVIDEMNKRHESMMNPKSHPLSTALTSLGFIYHLGLSPASAMVNLLQTPLVAYPVLGAKWGFTKSSAALMRASNEAIQGKNDISGSLQGDELDAYNEAVRRGVIDVTMAHDLAGIAQGEDSGVMWKIRPVMRWASFLFHNAERFNRQVTFIAAYRLAREAGTNPELAFDQAADATYKGHFDYSAGNRPRVMQGNVAKVVLLFKQFGQNMIYLLARQAYLAIKAADPAERSEARKMLTGLLVSHGLAAGALGLPLVTTLLAAASMIGGDDDEPWDAEVALRNMLADTFGDAAANVMTRGVSRATPWDISGRVGLDKLIFPDIQEGLEGQRLSESAMAAALGPVAGIATNVLKGMSSIADGQFGRGLEMMMPSSLRGPMKAVRYADEGAQDKTGITIQDEVGALGVIGQAMGFSPSDVRTATEGKSAIRSLDKKLSERRQHLLTQFARASIDGDQEGMAEARAEIASFNEKNPTRRIQGNHLMQSVKARKMRAEKAENGVYLPRNRQDAMDAGRFAFGE